MAEPNKMLLDVANELGYSAGGDPDHLVDVLEELLRRTDANEAALDGRDAGALEVHAERYRSTRQHYDKTTALAHLQIEGKLSLQQAAIFIGGSVTVEEVARWALPSLSAEAAVAMDELLRLGTLTYPQVAKRTGAPWSVVRHYGAKRGLPSAYDAKLKEAAASAVRVRELRATGMGVMDITRLLKAEGLMINKKRVSAICAEAGFATKVAS